MLQFPTDPTLSRKPDAPLAPPGAGKEPGQKDGHASFHDVLGGSVLSQKGGDAQVAEAPKSAASQAETEPVEGDLTVAEVQGVDQTPQKGEAGPEMQDAPTVAAVDDPVAQATDSPESGDAPGILPDRGGPVQRHDVPGVPDPASQTAQGKTSPVPPVQGGPVRARHAGTPPAANPHDPALPVTPVWAGVPGASAAHPAGLPVPRIFAPDPPAQTGAIPGLPASPLAGIAPVTPPATAAPADLEVLQWTGWPVRAGYAVTAPESRSALAGTPTLPQAVQAAAISDGLPQPAAPPTLPISGPLTEQITPQPAPIATVPPAGAPGLLAEPVPQAASGDPDHLLELHLSSDSAFQARAAFDPAHLSRAVLPRHVAMQVAEAIQRGPGRPVDLLLSPAELGRVRISLQTGEGLVSVHITADRPETLDLMRRHAEHLAQEFHEIGYGEAQFSFAGQGSGHQEDGGAPAHPGPLPAQARSDLAEPGAQHAIPAIHTDRVDIRI